MNTFMLDVTRSVVARYCAALTVALLVSCTSAPIDRRESIVLPATSPFPESVTASNDGTLFVSSITHGGVLKIAPGSLTPVTFVEPGEHGTRSTFGVFADDRRGTLWVASNDASVIGLKGPSTVEGAWIKGFDLTSGELKSSFRLPAPAIANDIATGADGALYVTNTAAPQILRIDRGTGAIDVFVQDDALKGGLDGIAFGADGHLYVNTFGTGELFRIEIRAGKAGKVTKLRTTRPLDHPDGLRSHQGGFMMVEGGGTLDRITIDDDKANVETVAQVAGPTGLWLIRDKAWIAEGQLSYLTDPTKKGTLPASFRLRALPLPP